MWCDDDYFNFWATTAVSGSEKTKQKNNWNSKCKASEKIMWKTKVITYSLSAICVLKCHQQVYYQRKVNIGLGNGLLPNGIKPLPKPMLTQI